MYPKNMRWFYIADYINNPLFLHNLQENEKSKENDEHEKDFNDETSNNINNIILKLKLLQRVYNTPSEIYSKLITMARSQKSIKNFQSYKIKKSNGTSFKSEYDTYITNNKQTIEIQDKTKQKIEEKPEYFNDECKINEMKNASDINSLMIVPSNHCPVCFKTFLTDESDMVGCDSCDRWIHFSCEGLSKRYLEKILPNLSYYECKGCKNHKNVLLKTKKRYKKLDLDLLKIFESIDEDKIAGGSYFGQKRKPTKKTSNTKKERKAKTSDIKPTKKDNDQKISKQKDEQQLMKTEAEKKLLKEDENVLTLEIESDLQKIKTEKNQKVAQITNNTKNSQIKGNKGLLNIKDDEKSSHTEKTTNIDHQKFCSTNDYLTQIKLNDNENTVDTCDENKAYNQIVSSTSKNNVKISTVKNTPKPIIKKTSVLNNSSSKKTKRASSKIYNAKSPIRSQLRWNVNGTFIGIRADEKEQIDNEPSYNSENTNVNASKNEDDSNENHYDQKTLENTEQKIEKNENDSSKNEENNNSPKIHNQQSQSKISSSNLVKRNKKSVNLRTKKSNSKSKRIKSVKKKKNDQKPSKIIDTKKKESQHYKSEFSMKDQMHFSIRQ